MNRKRLVYLLVVISWLLFINQDALAQRGNSPPKKTDTKGDVIKHFRDYGSDSKEHSEEFSIEADKKISYNYFRIDKSGRYLWNGKHWKPDDFPLTVYVKSNNSDYYKSLFRSYVDYALSIWEKADSRIEFKYVSNTRDADIVIMFEENLVDKYDDNYLGITDYRLAYDKKIQKSIIEIGLLKFNNEPVTDGEVKATIIHELGHALGLGHSDNEIDIMFPFINPFSSSDMHFNELSGGDIEAVKSVVNLGFGFILN
jgi:predicted Zn-dependent protease